MNKQEFAQNALRNAMIALGVDKETLEGMNWTDMSSALLTVAHWRYSDSYEEIPVTPLPMNTFFAVRSYTREEIAEMVNIDLSRLTDEEVQTIATHAGELISNTGSFEMGFESAVENLHPELSEIDDDDDEDDFDASDFEFEVGERVVAKKDLQTLGNMDIVIKAGTLGIVKKVSERLNPYDVAFDGVFGLFRLGDLDIDSAHNSQRPCA